MDILSIDPEPRLSRGRGRRRVSEDIRNVDHPLSLCRNPPGSNAVRGVKGKENRASISPGCRAVQILEANAGSLAALDDMQAQAAHFDHAGAASDVGSKPGGGQYLAVDSGWNPGAKSNGHITAAEFKGTRLPRRRFLGQDD